MPVYEIIKIDEKSWRIEENGVRSFLFAGTDGALLVDSGFGGGDIRRAVEELSGLPVRLVNTHADGDHTGCNRLFEEVYMHPSEFAYYYNKEREDSSPKAEARPLWEGDIIDLGGRSFEAILIPGHTPGSLALLDRANRLLISGDSISGGPVFMFGGHRDLRAYIASLQRLRRLGGFDVIYPSHGPFPLEADKLDKQLEGAKLLLKGELEAQAPPFDMPAKLYSNGGAAFFY